MDLGFLISFAGNITFPKAQPIRDVARQVPLDRILIETDAPFLAPVPNRGKRNEPAWVAEVAAKVAELKSIVPEEAAFRPRKTFIAFSAQRHSRKSRLTSRPVEEADNLSRRNIMASDNSFDVVSKVDLQEVKNAIDQASKEVHTRFDLKDTKSKIELEGDETIQLASATNTP